MQVMGDLIRLPANEAVGLPLPWFHRAPLGLSNDTSVFVALTTRSKGRPVPDLIVTVLNPAHWDQMFRLDCWKRDAPGVVSEVLQKIPPLNIALAETVKVEKDDLHHVSLICEPVTDEQDTDAHIERIVAELKESGFHPVLAERLPKLPELAWTRTGSVQHGWLTGIKWQQEIKAKYPATVEQADLRAVVASADTESRVLRYVFPRRGAMTVSIKHADVPNALAEITTAIRTCEANILSSFLRRGGGRGLDAEFVAVCEPNSHLDLSAIEKLKDRIIAEIGSLPDRFRPQPTIRTGRDAERTVSIRHPEEMVARPSDILALAIREYKAQLKAEFAKPDTIPIFVSHRFSDATQGSLTLENIRRSLLANNCYPVEAASTLSREPFTIYMDVSTKLWTAPAGIVLVTKELDSRHITVNLAHELGFLMGQGKPILILVEDEPECEDMMSRFVNLAGVLYKRFHAGASTEDGRSVQAIISSWIQLNVKSTR